MADDDLVVAFAGNDSEDDYNGENDEAVQVAELRPQPLRRAKISTADKKMVIDFFLQEDRCKFLGWSNPPQFLYAPLMTKIQMSSSQLHKQVQMLKGTMSGGKRSPSFEKIDGWKQLRDKYIAYGDKLLSGPVPQKARRELPKYENMLDITVQSTQSSSDDEIGCNPS